MSRLPPAFARHLKPARQPAGTTAMRAGSPVATGVEEALERAMQLRDKGELKEAEKICVSVLTRDPRNAKALLLAGSLARAVEDTVLGIEFFKKALQCDPDSAEAHLVLAFSYEEMLDYLAASRHFQRALEITPGSIPALRGLGRALIGADNIDLALEQFVKATRLDPSNSILKFEHATALMKVGRMDEAAAILRANIAKDPSSVHSYFALAQTQKFSIEPAELGALLALLDQPGLNSGNRANIHNTAGKILNDLGRYDEAIDHIKAGKSADERKYDISEVRNRVDTLIAAFTPELLKAKAGLGDPSEVPVFIVGMPRSGTSLTEQICASHSGVFGAGELVKMAGVVRSAGYTQTPNGKIQKHPQSLTSAEAKSLAGRYLDFIRNLSPDALRIIDKLPHNFLNIGMIALLLPNARIIHCRRDPIDNCVSIFLQAFNETHAYAADMSNLGLYYREYDRLMRHWNKLLPGRIHECSYEAVIADQESESRRLIDFLGLPWEDACLRYYEADRTVMTASLWQVRQPIYQSSVKRWKKYENKIQPLIEALGDLADV
jgi:tetratricopeptide (TPR) repeat protein